MPLFAKVKYIKHSGCQYFTNSCQVPSVVCMGVGGDIQGELHECEEFKIRCEVSI